jgi:hypothetical protein
MARPVVTGLSVHTGPTSGGTAVTIAGSNFTGATGVAFGSVAAQFQVQSDTQIAAGSPAHAAGAVDVEVTTPEGTSSPGQADQFMYMAPAPVVSGVAPNSGPAAGSTNVAINGQNFATTTGVAFGGAAAAFAIVSDNQLRATSPAHAAGTVDIQVTSPSGTSTPCQADKFTYMLGSHV